MQWLYQGWLVTSLYELKTLLTRLTPETMINEIITQVKRAKECLQDQNTEILAYIVERDPETNDVYITAILAYTEEDEVEPTTAILEQPIYPPEETLLTCTDAEP